MKKILRGVLSLLLVLSMCACTSKSNLSVDDAFYEDLKQGLINRWKLSDLNDDDYTTEDFNGYVKAELDCISKYKNAQFKKIVALSNLIQRIYHNDIRNMLP